jgi:hypothetical protein
VNHQSKQAIAVSNHTTHQPYSNSNHGSFFFSQLSSLKILVNDLAGAKEVIQTYFATTWQNQISADGEQVPIFS